MEDNDYIKRLKERLRQKPDSKLFLSLAEELRRRDMIDEAIAVLVEGIKKNPEFVTAHITLGRWYLSSEMLPEAKKEFSEALEKSPDNIFARRGLAEISKKMGEEPQEIKKEETEAISEEVPAMPAALVTQSRKEIVGRLNLFLDKVKDRFAFTKKDEVKDRLNRMIREINIRFAKLAPASASYKDR